MITCKTYRETRQRLSLYYEFRCGRCYLYNGLGWRFFSKLRMHSYSVYSYRETFPIAIALFHHRVHGGASGRTPDACFINTDRYSQTTTRHQNIVAESLRTGSTVHYCSQEVIRSLEDAIRDFQTPRDALFDIIENHVGQIREEREKELYDRGMQRLIAKTDTMLAHSGRSGVFNSHRLTYA